MKKAFTLIEILVSIVLLGLITVFTSSLLYQIKNNNKIFEQKIENDSKTAVLGDTLYRDIFQASSINTVTTKKYSVLNLKSKNSIYNIAEPYVTWFVLKKDNTLVRLESAKKIILPMKEELKTGVFADEIVRNCKQFNINISKNKERILSFIKIENKEPILFEIERL